MKFSGGCRCGAVRYEVKSSPFLAVYCHCESCRRATGSPVTGYIGLNRAQVTWVGARGFHTSSPGVTRGLCPECGTALQYSSTRWPGETHLVAATLDDPARFKPTAHMHWAERVHGFAADDTLPRYEGRLP